MSRKNKSKQPTVTRGATTKLPPGSKVRTIPKSEAVLYGSNLTGMNTTPIDVLESPQLGPRNYATTFLPGDPTRPTPGLDDSNGGPRQFAYQIGSNILALPRGTESTSFDQLRALAMNYSAIGICEQVLSRIIYRLDPKVSVRPSVVPPDEDMTSDKWMRPAQQMIEWFTDGPDRQYGGDDIHGWANALNRDFVELDAGVVFHQKTRAGYLHGLELIDPSTFQVLYDVGGRVPAPPYPAYRQVLYGAPAAMFTAEDIDYLRHTARTESRYGISPTERIFIIVNQALRKQSFDLRRWTDGSTPSGILESSGDTALNWTPDELYAYERKWNDILAGNDALRVRTKITPAGYTFKQTDPDEIATEFDRFLLNVTTASFGLTLDEIGFTENSNRSVGDSQENVTYRNAVKPRADFIARYFTKIIRRYHGTPLSAHNAYVSYPNSPTKSLGEWDARYMFSWGGIEEPEDFNAKVAAGTELFKSGLRSKMQVVKWLNLPADPGEQDVPSFIVAAKGMESVVVLEDIESIRENQKTLMQSKVDTAQAQTKKLLEPTPSPIVNTAQGEKDNASGDDGNSSQWPMSKGNTHGGSRRPVAGNNDDDMGNDGDDDNPSEDRGVNADNTYRGINGISESTDNRGYSTSSSTATIHGSIGDPIGVDSTGITDSGTERRGISAEWARFREKAIKAVKRGKVAEFETTILPENHYRYATQELATAVNVDTVRIIFANIREAESHPESCRCQVCGCGEPYEDHGKPYPVLATHDDGFEHWWIGLFLPGSAGQQLAIDGGVKPHDMHITLCMLDDSVITDLTPDYVIQTVRAWALANQPVYTDINHLHRFDNRGEKSAIVARTDTQAIFELRVGLLEVLKAADIPINNKFPDFKPHVTLCYVDENKESPIIPMPNVTTFLEYAWVCIGNERYAFPFGMQRRVDNAEVERVHNKQVPFEKSKNTLKIRSQEIFEQVRKR